MRTKIDEKKKSKPGKGQKAQLRPVPSAPGAKGPSANLRPRPAPAAQAAPSRASVPGEWMYPKGLPKTSERDYRFLCQELRECATSNDHFELKQVLIGRLPGKALGSIPFASIWKTYHEDIDLWILTQELSRRRKV